MVRRDGLEFDRHNTVTTVTKLDPTSILFPESLTRGPWRPTYPSTVGASSQVHWSAESWGMRLPRRRAPPPLEDGED